MKKIILFLVILICFNSYSQAQVESYLRYTPGGKAEPNINIFGTKKISEKVNLTYFTLVESTWSEALVGFSYSPKDWISLGVSTGIEHNPAVYRFGGSLWLGKGKTSLLMLGEKGDGKDNYWYKTVLSYKASDQFTLGTIAWRYHGVGPIVKFTPKKSDITVWFLPAHDFEYKANRLILGLNIKI